ncbi:MAG: GMC family oxidoreductase [Chloroflexota bacterium]
MPEKTADYIIVGAGTAGCVLAARLSADPQVTVTLLELGGQDSNPSIWDHDMNAMFSLWDPKGAENWGYATTPQTELNGRSIDIARGKVLGGSSAVNAKIYIRGHQRNFDSWAAMGNTGWSYSDVLPYFKTSEAYQGPPSEYHGTAGPLSVIDCKNEQDVLHAFVDAAASLGATRKYNDFNGQTQEAGAGFYQSTRKPNGDRVTAASAFLTPNLGRQNLRVITGARTTRVLIEHGRAVGVEYIGPDGTQLLRAEREVILCGGAYETPKLMMLSGIGPASHLAERGLAVLQDLPGVGQNLQDHLLLGVAYESQSPLNPPELLAEAGLFTWTGLGSRDAAPDLQYFFGPVQFVAPEYASPNPGFTLAPILAQPQSVGTVTLASNNPTDLAVMNPQYLTRDEDLAVLEYGIRYARELAHTSAFSALRGRELAPGDAVTSREDLRDYIRKVAGTVWHPVGTCKMGVDAAAVVDPELKVRGIDGLRIADASVMPQIVNGNPNAAIMMIAEKAADMILAESSQRAPLAAAAA